MKNFNLLRFAASFTLFVLLFSSCSEDALKQEKNNARSSNGSVRPDDVKTGFITATIAQNLKVYMIATNDSYTSAPEYSDEYGVILMKDVPEGEYDIQIVVVADAPSPRDYHDVTFSRITVNPDETTDLGVIEFQ